MPRVRTRIGAEMVIGVVPRSIGYHEENQPLPFQKIFLFCAFLFFSFVASDGLLKIASSLTNLECQNIGVLFAYVELRYL